MPNDRSSEDWRFPEELRERVEELLHARPAETPVRRTEDVQALVRELHARLTELGRRNEELRHVESQLSERTRETALLAEAVSHLGEGVLITSGDLDWPGPEIVFANEAMCRITGYSASELIGQTPRVLQGRDTDRAARDHIRAELSAGHSCLAQLVNYRKDGTAYDAELRITPIVDAAGNRTNFVSVHRDVSDRRRFEKAVREREQRLRAVLNTASDAIISIDARGIIDDVNPAAERMFGYMREEMIGSNVSMLMPSPFREEHDGYIERFLRTGEARIVGIGREVVAMHRDGHTFPVDLAVSEVDHMQRFTGIVRNVSELRRMQEHLLTIATEEQRWVGHELHDGVGQELAGLGMMADTLDALIQRGTMPRPAMTRTLAEGLRSANTQVRALARGLSPVDVDARGLVTAITKLGQQIEERSGIACDVDVTSVAPPIDKSTSTHLYRIAQEATNNAIRHGRPTRISIGLDVDDRLVSLEVRDDGVGIDESEPTESGLGMRIMRYRAGLLGGRLRVETSAGGGTTVACELPIARVGGVDDTDEVR